MISEVKRFTSKKGMDLAVVEVTPDSKGGPKIVVMKTEYGINICPEVNYFSKKKDTWVVQKEWFQVDQWNVFVALQGEVMQAVGMLGGDQERAAKDIKRVMDVAQGPKKDASANLFDANTAEDIDDIPF